MEAPSHGTTPAPAATPVSPTSVAPASTPNPEAVPTLEAAPPPKSRRLSLLVWALILILVVYPLSSGPLVKLWTMAGFPSDAMLGLYTPLIFLAFYLPAFRSAFTWYLSLWKAELLPGSG